VTGSMGRDFLNTPGVKPLLLLAAVGVILIILGSVLRTGTSTRSPQSPVQGSGAASTGFAATGNDTADDLAAASLGASGGLAGGTTVERYRSELESRCEAILSKVEGAGAVSVRITLAGGSSREYAQNSAIEESIHEEQASGQTKRSSERRQTRETVLATEPQSGRGQVPVLVTEQAPRIAGVLVAAPGAADSGVKRELARAAQTLLGVPAHRVMVVASRKP